MQLKTFSSQSSDVFLWHVLVQDFVVGNEVLYDTDHSHFFRDALYIDADGDPVFESDAEEAWTTDNTVDLEDMGSDIRESLEAAGRDYDRDAERVATSPFANYQIGDDDGMNTHSFGVSRDPKNSSPLDEALGEIGWDGLWSELGPEVHRIARPYIEGERQRVKRGKPVKLWLTIAMQRVGDEGSYGERFKVLGVLDPAKILPLVSRDYLLKQLSDSLRG